MMIADDIKKLLKGTIDEKLEVIERRTNERMKILLNTQEVPKEFETVVYEVSLKRFNRIGQEGMQSYSQEGLSMAFPDSDFSEYQNEIDEFKRKDQEELYKPKRGRFKFV
ncbi:phage head-tail connector protein [Enterococcus lactis]|uniref:phage head-tail connector protein n=1 Tax=Enterococcus lactis TaxID=357441 RepID=UPI002DB83409|nr:phage head-tail connector protein [Enterococcus lactis]MEB7841803.1 phage head-tail connector protein [Enterococcus lactis]MEB7853874.1 phage head-tail connector protein [Enterococcus lactis]